MFCEFEVCDPTVMACVHSRRSGRSRSGTLIALRDARGPSPWRDIRLIGGVPHLAMVGYADAELTFCWG
jgi:hypothetical protein